MRKITSLFLTLLMMVLLVGCAVPGLDGNSSGSPDKSFILTNRGDDESEADNKSDEEDKSDTEDKSDSEDKSDTDNKSDSDNKSDTSDKSDSDDKSNSDDDEEYIEPEAGYPDEYGDAEGTFEDTMHTAFFDYTVHSAYLCEDYEGYEPQDGNVILVADVTISNPSSYNVNMYDTDFQIQWGSDADDAFDFPITFYTENNETLNDEMLPYEYELRKYESRDGLLVFEVPEGETYFSISYLEIYNDDSEGNVFFVYFNADF
ncbi:MAG: DUF4352 domain-containing protein [Clostridiales bacterium]|nr:DUF4352 domain-containing protein [Clostridiales bacterium]